MHVHPDHEGLDSYPKSRTSKNQNCNQVIVDEDESFIERWDSDSGLDLGVGLKSGARSCSNWLTFNLIKIQVLMPVGIEEEYMGEGKGFLYNPNGLAENIPRWAPPPYKPLKTP
jgi:hypothetical protein